MSSNPFEVLTKVQSSNNSDKTEKNKAKKARQRARKRQERETEQPAPSVNVNNPRRTQPMKFYKKEKDSSSPNQKTSNSHEDIDFGPPSNAKKNEKKSEPEIYHKEEQFDDTDQDDIDDDDNNDEIPLDNAMTFELLKNLVNQVKVLNGNFNRAGSYIQSLEQKFFVLHKQTQLLHEENQKQSQQIDSLYMMMQPHQRNPGGDYMNF